MILRYYIKADTVVSFIFVRMLNYYSEVEATKAYINTEYNTVLSNPKVPSKNKIEGITTHRVKKKKMMIVYGLCAYKYIELRT